MENLRLPAKTFVDPKTDELYVADGYGNHRVIVYRRRNRQIQAALGRLWAPSRRHNLGRYIPERRRPSSSAIRCIARRSQDDLLYVCDRANDRIQVFQPTARL